MIFERCLIAATNNSVPPWLPAYVRPWLRSLSGVNWFMTTDGAVSQTKSQTHTCRAHDDGIIVWDIKPATRAVAQPASLTSHMCDFFLSWTYEVFPDSWIGGRK